MNNLERSIGTTFQVHGFSSGLSRQEQIDQIDRVQQVVNAKLQAFKRSIPDDGSSALSVSIHIGHSQVNPVLPPSGQNASDFSRSTFASFDEYNNDVQVRFGRPRDWCAIL